MADENTPAESSGSSDEEAHEEASAPDASEAPPSDSGPDPEVSAEVPPNGAPVERRARSLSLKTAGIAIGAAVALAAVIVGSVWAVSAIVDEDRDAEHARRDRRGYYEDRDAEHARSDRRGYYEDRDADQDGRAWADEDRSDEAIRERRERAAREWESLPESWAERREQAERDGEAPREQREQARREKQGDAGKPGAVEEPLLSEGCKTLFKAGTGDDRVTILICNAPGAAPERGPRGDFDLFEFRDRPRGLIPFLRFEAMPWFDGDGWPFEGDLLPFKGNGLDPFSKDGYGEETGQEPVDLTNPSILIPSLNEAIHTGSIVNGEPFQKDGHVPMTIVASTTRCVLVSIDTLTSQSSSIWDYPANDDRDFDCEDSDANTPSASGESFSSYIDNLEWVDPSLLLVSLCCEPAVGRFEVIDTSNDIGPTWLALDGGSPALNEDNVLLYSLPFYLGERATSVIGSMAFDVRYDESDPDYPFYSLESEPTVYALSFGPTGATDIQGFVSGLSWVGEDKIAFELWTWGSSSTLHPFVGLIDLESNLAIFGSRKDGWTLPSGDGSSNLVVVEQACNRINGMINSCASDEAKIVVLDSNSLAPIYEVVVDGSVVDMDLHRGWLLVTFSSGHMGILDLVDGLFSPVADEISHAVWAE